MSEVSVLAWFEAFVLTFAIEAAIAVPMLRAVEPSRFRRLALCLFANLASHPAVWFIIPRFGLPDAATMVVAEGWALVLEGLFYALTFRGLDLTRAMWISTAANAVSYSVGVLLHVLRVF